MNIVRFYGLTGDADLMFNNELEAGAGMYFEIEGKKIIMDPGPGTFVKFNHDFPRRILELDALILSHIHFDHSNDINLMIEGMTNEGKCKKGLLITSSTCYSGEKKVIHDYLKSYPERTNLVDIMPTVDLGNIQIKAVEHRHSVRNYGYILTTESSKVSIITDTGYFDGLSAEYEGSTTLIINTPYNHYPKGKTRKHLSLDDVKILLKCINPRKTILTHFGSDIYKAGVSELVNSLSDELGLNIQAASCGTNIELL